MSCETLENAVDRMKLVCKLDRDICGDGRGVWCSEHHDCDECHADAFQRVLDAFDRERELISEREYDRGYRDGKQAKLAGNTREGGDAEHGYGGGNCESDSCDRGDCGGPCADGDCGGSDLQQEGQKDPQEMSVAELIEALKEASSCDDECREILSTEWCDGSDNCHVCRIRLLNLLKAAHEREVASLEYEKSFYKEKIEAYDDDVRRKIADLTHECDGLKRRLEELNDAGITSLHRLLRNAIGDAKCITDAARNYVENSRKSRKPDPEPTLREFAVELSQASVDAMSRRAEREAVIERLRKLDFTQKNVSVYEIVCVVLGYEPAPWWNRENSAALCDKLIELLSDEAQDD